MTDHLRPNRYTMLLGRPPFETTNLKETYRCIREARYSMPSSLSPQAKHLISSMLAKNPVERPQLDDILRHDFFCQVCVRLCERNMSPGKYSVVWACFSPLISGFHTRQTVLKLLPRSPRSSPHQSCQELLQESCCRPVRWKEGQSQVLGDSQ